MSRHLRAALRALLAAITVVVTLAFTREAGAVPAFARKYQTSCTTCHTVYPVLNPFGEAFRRNGYRFPTQNGATDSDVTKANVLALGQEEYKKRFPDAVWPASIAQEIPLGVMVNGGVSMNLPGSDAHDRNGNTFTWDGAVSEFHLFGAGSINDNLTYFTQLTVADGGIDIETAYMLWSDIAGPAHMLNLWVGRLMAPSLNSWGMHSSYLSDTFAPATPVVALFNPTGTFVLGQGHNDGIELNGVVGHRFDWSLGWLASGAVANLKAPNAEDVYAHVGVKIGGMSLDGEGVSGVTVANPNKPWAETSLTLDVFGYHGKTVLDNGTGVGTAVVQDDEITAVGGTARLSLASLLLTGGVQYEKHGSPFQGTAGTPANPPTTPDNVNGTPDLTSAHSLVSYGELDYVVWPWFVPGVRVESTSVTRSGGDTASIVRVIPGISMLVRPDVKVILTGTIERAKSLSPTGDWSPTGATISPNQGESKLQAEQINATVAFAY